MTVGYVVFAGAESGDPRVDGSLFAVAAAPAGWSQDTGIKRTGQAAWKVVANGSETRVYLGDSELAGGCAGFGMGIYLPASPSVDFYLIKPDVTTVNRLALQMDTNRRLRAVDITTGAAYSGWSAALPLSTWCYFIWFLDGITFADQVYTALLLDTGAGLTEQWAVATGAGKGRYQHAMHILYDMPNLGINLYLDDIFGMMTATAGDRPHLTHWPVPYVARQTPDEDQTAQWQDHLGGTGSYAEWDETGACDEDSTYNTTYTTSKMQLGYGKTADEMGLGAGALILHNYTDPTKGPAVNIIHKVVGTVTKWGGLGRHGLGGDSGITQPGTTYQGGVALLPKTSPPWTRANIGANTWGVATFSSDHDAVWRVSQLSLQWPVYEVTAPLITNPITGLAFGAITTDTLVAASFPGGSRRFGAVLSTEVVNPAAGARRWGAVPSDESVPDPWV